MDAWRIFLEKRNSVKVDTGFLFKSKAQEEMVSIKTVTPKEIREGLRSLLL